MVSLRPVIISILLSVLFIIAVISGGIYMAEQNGASENIGNDSAFSSLRNDLIDKTQDNYDSSLAAMNSLENSSISLTSGIPFLDSIYGGWKVIKATPMIMYNLITASLFERLLGSQTSAIIIGIISAILIITIIFAVIKLVSTGDGG